MLSPRATAGHPCAQQESPAHHPGVCRTNCVPRTAKRGRGRTLPPRLTTLSCRERPAVPRVALQPGRVSHLWGEEQKAWCSERGSEVRGGCRGQDMSPKERGTAQQGHPPPPPGIATAQGFSMLASLLGVWGASLTPAPLGHLCPPPHSCTASTHVCLTVSTVCVQAASCQRLGEPIPRRRTGPRAQWAARSLAPRRKTLPWP